MFDRKEDILVMLEYVIIWVAISKHALVKQY